MLPFSMTEDISSLPVGLLLKYRKFAFPPQVAEQGHSPFFSLEDPEKWVKLESVKAYQEFERSGRAKGANIGSASLRELKAYQEFLLPAQSVSIPFFALDTAKNWVQEASFQSFQQCPSRPSTTVASETSTLPRRTQEADSEGAAGKQLSATAKGKKRETSVIIISDDDDDDSPCVSPSGRSRGKRARTHVVKSEPACDVVEIDSDSGHEDSIPCGSGSNKRKRAAAVARSLVGAEIRVTKKEFVADVQYITDVPNVWDVPQIPTAYVVDFSDDERELLKGSGDNHSITSFIRHEDRDSWRGSAGQREGDVWVINLFGQEKMWCRHADLTCNGIKTCEFFDQGLLRGYERFEASEDDMRKFWKAELDANERESGERDGFIARFYNRVMNSKCRIECGGILKLRPLRNSPSKHGKVSFVGCSKWKRDEELDHRYVEIDANIDEDDLRYMLENDGHIRSNVTVNGTCSLLVHPRSHKETCTFTHIIDGQSIKNPRIVKHTPKCGAHLLVFEPVDRTIRKAVVIPKRPHNHPAYLHVKASYREKELAEKAFKAGGTSRLTPKKLRIAPSTDAVLAGGKWNSKLPGLTDHQSVRKLVSCLRQKDFPLGLGWTGLQHEASKREHLLPPEKRYIHNVMSQGDIKIAVTMLPRLVQHIHSVRYLAIDYTFKRTIGEINEWEVASNLDRYKKRITLASLYCNRATREAFVLLFQEFFATVRRVTGKALTFRLFDKNAPLRCIIFDAEPAQIQGFGDVILPFNDRAATGITTTDPLEMAQCLSKTCSVHFDRNIDGLPREIPRDVIQRLKGFIGLHTAEDIEAWHLFCKASPYEAVQNWYRQKISHPWYLPSVNRFLSPMDRDSWDVTPNHTNIVETAHAGRNAETGISAPVLGAINDARARDEAVADELELFEQNGVLTNRWNGPQERECCSANRRAATRAKLQVQDSQRAIYEALEGELAAGKEAKAKSLDRQKCINARLEEIKQTHGLLPQNLITERDELRVERQHGVDERQMWVVRRLEIEQQMKDLKEGSLKGVRMGGLRPETSPEKENNFRSADTDSEGLDCLPMVDDASLELLTAHSPLVQREHDMGQPAPGPSIYSNRLFDFESLDFASIDPGTLQEIVNDTDLMAQINDLLS